MSPKSSVPQAASFVSHALMSDRGAVLSTMSDDEQAPAAHKPSPRENMRGWRPYLFSDSEIDHRPRLSKPAFKLHLDTLTVDWLLSTIRASMATPEPTAS